ncbi:MAG: tyrosine-type recombinase/integrase, partial [Terrimesophilobacter sp.]
EGTPLTANNVRRQLRHVMDLAGITGVTPHLFRRTVATAINEQAGINLAAELLGHSDPRISFGRMNPASGRGNAQWSRS